MKPDLNFVRSLEPGLESGTRKQIDDAAAAIVDVKRQGGRVVVVTGSGPNLHEGVTTLLAELIRVGVVDGVTTSSAVIAHELGGALDRVKRVDGRQLDLAEKLLPLGNHFELTLAHDSLLKSIDSHMPLDWTLIERLKELDGEEVIKAAGNLGYPVGLWLERLSLEVLAVADERGATFEEIVGPYCDRRTMLGAGARKGVPVLVTIPQLIGGGRVGLAIGDSVSIADRASRLAAMLAGADLIVESAVVLTQEVHDGPLETYTGHGLWSGWEGEETYSLKGKRLIRIDLDPVLEVAWAAQRQDRRVQEAINSGLPKTKLIGVPFRMEMSGFARLEGSIPVIADIGVAWPLLALKVSEALGIDLEMISCPQETEAGKAMREWIVQEVLPMDWERFLESQRG